MCEATFSSLSGFQILHGFIEPVECCYAALVIDLIQLGFLFVCILSGVEKFDQVKVSPVSLGSYFHNG